MSRREVRILKILRILVSPVYMLMPTAARPSSMTIQDVPARWAVERYDEAIAAYMDSIVRNPDHIGPRIGLTSCLAEVGRLDEARAETAEVLRINPTFTLAKYAESLTYRDPAHAERSLNGLREAGLPD